MGIKKIHIKILECYEYDDYTVKELKGILGISEKKIRLYINELYEYCGVDNLSGLKSVIRKNSGWRREIKNDLEIEKDDREKIIQIEFLMNDIVNLNEISYRLKVNRRTITEDLKKVRNTLKEFKLDYGATRFMMKSHDMLKVA
ncbi:hypothetical protein [Cetobacterium sp.]